MDRANVFYWPSPREGKEVREAKGRCVWWWPLAAIFGKWPIFGWWCLFFPHQLYNIGGKSASEASALPPVVSKPRYFPFFLCVSCPFL